MAYVIIWQFEVTPEKQDEFEQIYGSSGEWAKLFARERSHIGTELLLDTRDANRYLTIDKWESEDAYETFRSVHEQEYQQIDERCEALTISEQEIGRFSTTGEP
ncbi:MAG TPA: antibiotic biosynthesis monooxygenase family protein [Terriglobales bacterium]